MHYDLLKKIHQPAEIFIFSNSPLFRVNHLCPTTPSVKTMLRHMQLLLLFWYRKCSPSYDIPRLMANYHTWHCYDSKPDLLNFWAGISILQGKRHNLLSVSLFQTLTRLNIGACKKLNNCKFIQLLKDSCTHINELNNSTFN